MKKKVLPLAVGAASAVAMTAAHAAMYINERGTGETLIFPFYSAQSGNTTLVNLANTTGAHKAVKVRILEGENSQEVLDFNLYLSPEDHFSFAISATDAGGGQITTGDNSCTVPAIPADGQAFRTLLIEGDVDEGDEDGVGAFDNSGVERTAVGYIEIIEMGQLDPDADALVDAARGTAAADQMNVATAITHDADGVPNDCSLVIDAWTDMPGTAAPQGLWFNESEGADGTGDSEFVGVWNGGGLYGYATVINVPEGSAFGYDAVAIADHVGAGADGSDMHYAPGDIFPNFADLAFDNSAIITEDGESVEITFTAYSDAVDRVQALNATMMADSVMNDYVTDAAIAAKTDWLFTFPTKTLHIGNGEEPIEPFSELWTGQSACEDVSMDVVDREESTPPPPPPGTSTGPDFSPAPPPGDPDDPESNDIPLCFETTMMQFAAESATGVPQDDGNIAIGVGEWLEAADGWATVSMDPADLFDAGSELSLCGTDADADTTTDQTNPCDRTIDGDDADGGVFMTGLPVVGFAVQKYVNGSAGGAGVLANYAMSTVHKSTVAISR